MKNNQDYTGLEIAIIGIACRFPGAKNWRQYWENLKNGVESIHYFSDEELLERGVQQDMINNKNFVNAAAILKDKDAFDSSFFDYRPGEAQLLHPLHRIFHECVWEALEDSGYYSDNTKGLIGLYAGGAIDINWAVYSMIKNSGQEVDDFTLNYINNKDYLASLLSYKLNLKGPAFSINTACSTSLVAVSLACKSLLLGETKIALAGGVSIKTDIQSGYLYQENMIHSSDGHCRAFDKDASGTIGGEGAGVVVLKRLADALNDGDHIYSIIKGSAINNDGNRKVGFTAPSIDGQVECIIKAQRFAKVAPETISYVEAHGTGTKLGDPIEIEALNTAFNNSLNKSCAIGSVKTNIGHLDSAAGIAGLIKTALSLKYGYIPPSLHFNQPNPEINFSQGPFYVNTKLKKWERNTDSRLRAGVSSFGVGGTNAHVILEEAPQEEQGNRQSESTLLTLSAKTEESLMRYIGDLQNFLIKEPAVNLSDLAYALQVGRRHYGVRKSLVFNNYDGLIQLLGSLKSQPQLVRSKEKNQSLVFMFSGAGSQYRNMGKDLYLREPLFKKEMDKGFQILERLTGENYKDIIYPDAEDDSRINEMLHTQPLIFLFGYSLAQLMMSWGIIPQCMIGHSLGEYIAACISGVFKYEDALSLMVKRGQLMSRLPVGAMVSVNLGESRARELLTNKISLAAINGPEQVVFSGIKEEIDTLCTRIEDMDISLVKLQATQAGHSYMMDLIVADYRKELEKVKIGTPQIPFISNVTGDKIMDYEATSIDYWLRHIRETVRFSKGIQTILAKAPDSVFVEIGGGRSLTALVRQHQTEKVKPTSVNLIRHVKEEVHDEAHLCDSLGKIWSYGAEIDWSSYHKDKKRRRLPLPTYSFEPIRYPTEVNPFKMLGKAQINYTKERNIQDWFYRVQWRQSIWVAGNKKDFANKTIICFSSDDRVSEQLRDYFNNINSTTIFVKMGRTFEHKQESDYIINPFIESDIKHLFGDLKLRNLVPDNLFHFWNVDDVIDLSASQNIDVSENIGLYQKIGYENILNVVRNFNDFFPSSNLHIDVVGNAFYKVLSDESIVPSKSTTLGALKVIPKEFPNISCRAIDIDSFNSFDSLLKELSYQDDELEVAIRGNYRYLKGFEHIVFNADSQQCKIKKFGTYLITGANGGMCSVFSDFLTDEYFANLILIGRSKENVDFTDKLKKRGSKVYYIQSDIADSNRINIEVEKAEKTLGTINGVIHTAGLGDFAGVILNRSFQDDAKVFSPKVFGTKVLASIFRGKSLDFFVNCSSVSASVAPFGQVAYVASNLYLDAFAEQGTFNFPIVSIEWTAMQGVGMAINSTRHLSVEDQKELLKFGISTQEAIEVLRASISLEIPVPVISVEDFSEVVRSKGGAIDDNLPQDVATTACILDRNGLSSNYIPPYTETEKVLTSMVEKFFGIRQIGIGDNFFEIGGDSLKAMMLIRKISKELNVTLTLKDFFAKPTIKQIAGEIGELQALLRKKKIDSKPVKTIRI